MKSMSRTVTVALALGVSACAYYPPGPSQMALPGTAYSFEQFRSDDAACQDYAARASGALSAQQGAQKGGVDSAVAGAVVGAAAGALIGAASGDAAAGAAIGGGSGLLLGSVAGSDAYATTGFRVQDRYDNAYVQCMYAKGHQVPVPASVAAAQHAQPAPTLVAPATVSVGTAYPPPGTPPPPGY